jgi:hypothetical protein
MKRTFAVECFELRKLVACVLLVLASIVTPGCDRPVARDPVIPPEKHIFWLVEDVDDRSSSPGELDLMKKLFAPGCEPSKEALARYTAYRYKGNQLVQSGDSATVTVTFTDAKTGDPAGELPWSMTRIDGRWKIKDAPLPAAGGKNGG